ncbi:MAG: hypothetical protein ACMXYG_01020 [Candidatus Woesearchaeota archaeon]
MAPPVIKHKYSNYVKKEIIFDTRIKHKDYFDMKYLYMMCHEWFMEHKWGPSSDQKWPETMYLHRWLQSGSEEIWIWWRFRKQFNRFIRYDLDVDWHIIGLEKAEMVKDGKKYKMNKGEAEFKIYVKLIFDAGGEFNSGFLKSVKETFWQRMYYKDILAHRKQLYHQVYEFKQAVKTYFNLQQYLPEPELHKFFKDDTLHTPFVDPAPKGPSGGN